MNYQNYQEWSKDQFTKTLQHLDIIYYNGGESEVVVSDAEYDFLREKYEEKYGKWEHIGAVVKLIKKQSNSLNISVAWINIK